MTTTPDPTAADLLADAEQIIASKLNFVTQGATPAGLWQYRYRQWLTQQHHPARGGTA